MGDATDLAEAINSIRSILGSCPDSARLRNGRLSLKQAIQLAFECEFGDRTFTSIANRIGWTRSRLSKLFKTNSLKPSTIGSIIFVLQMEELRELIVQAYIDHELGRRPINYSTITNVQSAEELPRLVSSLLNRGQYWQAYASLTCREKFRSNDDDEIRRVVADLKFTVAYHARSYHIALRVAIEIIEDCRNGDDPYREAFGHLLRGLVLIALQPPRFSDAENALMLATSLITETNVPPRENVLYGEATTRLIDSLYAELRHMRHQVVQDEYEMESEYDHLIKLAAESIDHSEKASWLTLAAAKLIELDSPMFALKHLKSAHRLTSDFELRQKQLVLMARAKVQDGDYFAAMALLRSVDNSYTRWVSPFEEAAVNDLAVVENQLFMNEN